VLMVNSPWNAHSDSGSTRLAALWVRISGKRKLFQTLRALYAAMVAIAGRISGNARRHIIDSPAPRRFSNARA
jgi:hypothetical protein